MKLLEGNQENSDQTIESSNQEDDLHEEKVSTILSIHKSVSTFPKGTFSYKLPTKS